MSYLFQKSTGIWYLQFRHNGRQVQRSLKTDDKRIAKKLQAQHDLKNQTALTGAAPRRCDLAQALDDFLLRKSGLIAAESLRRLRDYTKRLGGFFLAERITAVQELTPEVLAAYARQRLTAASPKTVRDELMHLKAVLRTLETDGLIERQPVKSWPAIKVRPKAPEKLGPYSAEEIGRIREFFRGQPFGEIFTAMIFTGARVGELAKLRKSDYSPGDRVLRLWCHKTIGSGESERYLAVHPELAVVLQARITTDDPLFFPEIEDSGHSRNWCRRHIRRACKALGIQYRRVHGFRHTFATYLLGSGASLMDTMEAMGHTNIGTTQRYLKGVKKAGQIEKLPY